MIGCRKVARRTSGAPHGASTAAACDGPPMVNTRTFGPVNEAPVGEVAVMHPGLVCALVTIGCDIAWGRYPCGQRRSEAVRGRTNLAGAL